jgi:hypothetical protein
VLTIGLPCPSCYKLPTFDNVPSRLKLFEAGPKKYALGKAYDGPTFLFKL